MADSIKEFLVGLGFRVDEPSFNRFQRGVAGVTKDVVALGGEAFATASAVVLMVERVGRQYENLYYVGQRTGSLVSGLKGYGFGMEQIGISAEAATSAVEGFASAVRNNPGLRGLVQGMGVNPADAQKAAVAFVEKLKGTGQPYFVSAQIAQMYGMDERTFFHLYNNLDKLRQKQSDYQVMLKEAGFDANAASVRFLNFSNSVDKLQGRFSILRDRIASDFLPYAEKAIGFIDGLLQKFTQLNTESGGNLGQGAMLAGTGAGVIATRSLLGKIFPGLVGGGGLLAGTAGALFSVGGFAILGKAFDEMYGKDMPQAGITGEEGALGAVRKGARVAQPWAQKTFGEPLGNWLRSLEGSPLVGAGAGAGGPGAGGASVIQNNKTDIHIQAGPTAWDTASLVGAEQGRINADYLRYLGTKVQ